MKNKWSVLGGGIFFLINVCLSIPVFAQVQESELNKIDALEQKTELLQNAVSALQKFRVSGYIQTQYQYGEAAADGVNFRFRRANSYEGDAYYPGTDDYKGLDGFSRFGIRRGRFRLAYEEGIVSGVVQIDVTERGINNTSIPGRNVVMFRDFFLNISDPWFGTSAFRAGLFPRPFGHEVSFSSARRESPERSRIIQSIFPDERDLGAMLVLQAAGSSNWNFLRLEGGLFAGNGIRPQISSRMDFIGRLSATRSFGHNTSLSGGLSLYWGGVLQTDSSRYIMENNQFVLEGGERSRKYIGSYAKRQYVGVDFQYSQRTSAGLTQLRAEYIFGEHPGDALSAYNFILNDITSGPVYMRKIEGGYVVFVQDLGQKIPLSAIAKYDWYNPNIDVSGNEIAAVNSGTGVNDIAISTVGFGLLWRINPALNLTAYYDIVSNETTVNLPDTRDLNNNIIAYGYEKNRPDNVFTLRLQYRF